MPYHDCELGHLLGLGLLLLLNVVHDNINLGEVVLGETLHVDAKVVTDRRVGDRLVMHLDGEGFAADATGRETDGAVRLQESLLNSAGYHITDTLDLVHARHGHAEGLLLVTLGWLGDGLKRVVESHSLQLLLRTMADDSTVDYKGPL